MAEPFSTLLGNMQAMGFFQFLFPFLLMLAISYGVLEFALGGEKKILPKSANALISIIIAFFIMNYSGTVGITIASFFTTLFGTGLVVATGILLVVILLGLLGWKVSEAGVGLSGVTLVVIVFIVFLVFVGAMGGVTGIPGIGQISLGSDFWTIIFFIIILVVVMWVLTKGEGAPAAAGGG